MVVSTSGALSTSLSVSLPASLSIVSEETISEEETEEEDEAGLEAMELVGLEFSFEELCLEDSFFEELSEVDSDSI